MTFVGDYEAFRTYDRERGLELRTDGGGSSGLLRFIIHKLGEPAEALAGFLAFRNSRPATEQEREVQPGLVEVTRYDIQGSWGPGLAIPGYRSEDSIEIFREALRAFSRGHGMPTTITRYEA